VIQTVDFPRIRWLLLNPKGPKKKPRAPEVREAPSSNLDPDIAYRKTGFFIVFLSSSSKSCDYVLKQEKPHYSQVIVHDIFVIGHCVGYAGARNGVKYIYNCLLPASLWFLTWLILRSWSWRWHVPPKRRLTFNGLHGVISQKTEPIITTAVKTSDPTIYSWPMAKCDLSVSDVHASAIAWHFL
jgi:hypothetical protein